ncbi:MAG: YbgA family protein [Planctomycetota bacterium]
MFAYRRLKTTFGPRWTRKGVVAFHTAEKLLLMAHHLPGYKALGKLVAAIAEVPRADFAERYQQGFMEALARPATVGRHVNVLQHAQGYFKRQLEADERAELSEVIADYRAELVPLIVPVTLIRHHARRFGVDYLLGQTYLAPHPKELMLRNHV